MNGCIEEEQNFGYISTFEVKTADIMYGNDTRIDLIAAAFKVSVC